MKRIFTKNRTVSGFIGLTFAAGLVSATPAVEITRYRASAPFENIFLGEIATTTYAEAQAHAGVIGEVEVVRERYADGKVRVERQVTLNNDGNYVNHGGWKLYSTTGDVLAEGQYNFGQRAGLWTRWVGRNEAALLGENPFKQFKAPLMSQANFADGKMDGEWIVTDANERKVLAISLKAGQRHGLATTWLPTGKVFSEVTYDQGVPVGEMLAVNTKTGELAKAATFDRGRKVVTTTEHYPRSKQVKSEIMYLAAKAVQDTQDDFWAMKLAHYGTEGNDVRQGSAKSWYPNGQQEMEGFYTNDQKTGMFTYWHANGQISTTGEYRDGQADGTWVWWHDNGQKSAVGKYNNGTLIGDWRWWDDQGKLTKQQTYNGTESASTEKEEHLGVSHKAAGSVRH